MKPYGNLGRNSGVAAYEVGPDFIVVEFSTGAMYEYTYESAGRDNIEHMKQLAESGHGLNSFINTEVRNLYAARKR